MPIIFTCSGMIEPSSTACPAASFSQALARRGNSRLRRLSAARQRAVPEEHAPVARVPGDLWRRRRISSYLEKTRCPANDQLCEVAVWLTQTMLLGPRSDMDQIAAAVRKIQKNGARLV